MLPVPKSWHHLRKAKPRNGMFACFRTPNRSCPEFAELSEVLKTPRSHLLIVNDGLERPTNTAASHHDDAECRLRRTQVPCAHLFSATQPVSSFLSPLEATAPFGQPQVTTIGVYWRPSLANSADQARSRGG
jgi:hypothetical protein